ncbi:hypothetical protein TRAPUB_6988 [Trametes pubescens]|uniref:Uncharacterized protein n=1 Tax=Trametes pubescens TaxID=154538 RepID=A0A1M2V4H3_TRAPU|nr:hypothetical protein TRAPUB_6988 [Trametes pubescens]
MHAFDGKVAAQGAVKTLVITSPNMDFVPEYPIERRVIQTFSDGRWGVHEYSRWPQLLVPEMMHVACIPARPNPPAAPEVLWADLHPSTSWEEDTGTGVKALGFLIPELANALADAAAATITSVDTSQCTERDTVTHAETLKLVLRQLVERMLLLPARAGIAIAVAAHVQRLTLELLGVQTYIQVVLPRMKSTFNYDILLLPVIGTFVREGTTAQTCTRVGLPTWFLQPMTDLVKVWRVVDVRPVPSNFARDQSQPPVFQNPQELAGVTNTTGNWLRFMALKVSEAVCGTRLAYLGDATDGEDSRPTKRPHLATDPLPSKHLHMAPPQPVPQRQSTSGKKKTRRGGQRKKAPPSPPVSHQTAGDQPTSQSAAGSSQAAAADRSPLSAAVPHGPEAHPSRTFASSLFGCVPAVWTDALRRVSPVQEPPQSTTYFYAPPFLLDSVVEHGLEPPQALVAGNAARVDQKASRYVHNWVRIRRFCRARLFDHSISNAPLTIAEWRAALWGDYDLRTHRMKGTPSTDLRRAQRRQDERNLIGRLFGRLALLPSYDAASHPTFDSEEVTLYAAATNVDLRSKILWESHEVNFRCELMALDTHLVQRPTWTAVHRWERERAVSGVWGEPSSTIAVLPREGGARSFCWPSPPSPTWEEGRPFLLRFLEVLRWWPDCPDSVVANSQGDGMWAADEYADLQRTAVRFYVETFARVYSRLPVPPLAM